MKEARRGKLRDWMVTRLRNVAARRSKIVSDPIKGQAFQAVLFLASPFSFSRKSVQRPGSIG
jgi:hypothetical protein